MRFLFIGTILILNIFQTYAKNFTLSGQIKNNSENVTILLKEYNTLQNVQTILETLYIKPNGKFESKVSYGPGIYQVDFKGITKVNIATEGRQKIVINLIIPSNSNHDPQVLVEGSKDAKLVFAYDELREQSYNKWLKPVRREMRLAKEAGKVNKVVELSITETENLGKYQDDLAHFAEKNFDNSIALFYAAVRLNPDRHLNFMQKISAWSLKKWPDLPLTRKYNQRVARFKNLAIGKQAPNLKLNSFDNKVFQLSSLKGNYVLLDFWASWCTPCRVENPNYARLYKKYKVQGFEIFSVSIDTNSKLWQQASKRDKINWVDTSDLKGWESESVLTYNVTSIPANFLLDKKGHIIAKNVRGLALEQKLEEIFSSTVQLNDNL